LIFVVFVKSEAMNGISTTEVLNRLVAIHNRSLPMYLSEAPPWTQRRDAAAREALMQIVADQKTMVDRLGQMILEKDGAVDLGEYPLDFTAKHDLSLEFLLGELVAHQRRDVAAIEECVRQLEHGSMARAVAQEALGEAKGHIESLQELAQEISGVNSAT